MFKYRFLIALLTFGVGVAVIGIWKGLPIPQNQPATSSADPHINQPLQEKIDLIADQAHDDIKQKMYLPCPDNQTPFTFRGISFNCSSKIGSKIEVTEFLKSPMLDETDKADYVHPSYLSFQFKNEAAKQKSKTAYTSEIAVYPIEEYGQMFSITEPIKREFDKDIASLRKTIFDKQADRKNYTGFLAAADGGFWFKSHLKYISFKNGKGVGFVTQIQIEVTIINNKELVWVFEGITNDGKYYVRAIFPIRAGFLPESFMDDFEGYSSSDYLKLTKRNAQYLSLVKRRLEALPSNQYQPDLKNLAGIISSLEIK